MKSHSDNEGSLQRLQKEKKGKKRRKQNKGKSLKGTQAQK